MGLRINEDKDSTTEAFEYALQSGKEKDFTSALKIFQEDTIEKAKKSFMDEGSSVSIDSSKESSPFMKVKNFDNAYKFKQKFTGGCSSGKEMSIGDFGKGVLFNQWGEYQQQANKVDGSILAPESILSDVIYKASQHSVLLGNCPIIPMETGTVIIGKVKDDLELDFKEKGAEGKETDLGLEGIKLEAKTLYAYIGITEEDLQDVENLDDILTNAFSMAIAKALDNNFLYTNPNASSKPGVYPNGILDNPNIKRLEVPDVTYDMVASANLEIAKSNGAPNTLGFNPIENFKLQTMKDSTGQYIAPPSFYSDLTKISSNGLKPNDIIVFDANQILVGIRKEMDIKVLPDLKKGMVIMRCMLRADVLPIREDHICKITINE